MITTRAEILRRIQDALRDVPPQEQADDVMVARTYQRTTGMPHAELVAQFIERTTDYKAAVHHISESALPARIVRSCVEHHIERLVVPTDLPAAWLPMESGIEILPDTNLSYAELDNSSGVLTGCALAIAQTGTIVLDAGTHQGRRVITLLPDYHLCIVYTDQIVGSVPEAIARLGDTVRNEGRPVTFISGPSATSDIELNRVEGVHGPRTLEVVVVERE